MQQKTVRQLALQNSQFKKPRQVTKVKKTKPPVQQVSHLFINFIFELYSTSVRYEKSHSMSLYFHTIV